MDRLLRKIRDAGLNIENKATLKEQILRKSYYRYSKLMNIYMRKKDVKRVNQSIVNEVYISDIRLRRELQKVLTALEVTMRAQMHNTFYDFRDRVVSKQKTKWENDFLFDERIKRNSYVYARRGFRWSSGNSSINIQEYINSMTFGHLIATYFAIDPAKINKDYRSIPLTIENVEKLDAIRIVRNILAHHGFLYEIPNEELNGVVQSIFSLVDFGNDLKTKIQQLQKTLESL